jgi:hypothetical protein
MKERIFIDGRKRLKARLIIKILAFCFPIIAVILLCSLSLSLLMPIPIETPAILVLGSIFALIPLRSEVIARLQQITGFYLIAVAVNQLSSNYFMLPFLSTSVSVSYSILVLFLFSIGYFLEKIGSIHKPLNMIAGDVLHGWLLALSIVIIHISLLSLVLHRFYSYGYERNLAVLGNLILYFLLFLVMWRKLFIPSLRRCLGLVMMIFYLVVTVAQQGP